MSLTAALDSARASLMASGIQSSTISRNIAGASAAGYSRKIAVLDNLPGAGDPARRQLGSLQQRLGRDLVVGQAERDL
jgi:flagellar hook-associated protein FlgK